MSEQLFISPSFAREAAQRLRSGDVQGAVQLCTTGTSLYPSYATGHFVLGKCHELLGRMTDAIVEYRKALTILPDNGELQACVQRAEAMRQKEFRRYAETTEKNLQATKETIPPEVFLAPQAEESAIEFLARRLSDVKRIRPTSPQPPSAESSMSADDSTRFVTATMAEIYATQGEYTEAIRAYQEIIRNSPEESDRYKKRIVEIEQLLAIKQGERRLEDPQNAKAS